MFDTWPVVEKKDFTYIQQGYKYVGQIYKGTDDFFPLSLNEVEYLKNSHNKKEVKFTMEGINTLYQNVLLSKVLKTLTFTLNEQNMST